MSLTDFGRDFLLITPVILLVFNRPDTTARIFAEVAKAKPQQLFVVADGPRPDRPDDVEKCAATRAIFEQVNWDCELTVNYAHTNLGLHRRVVSGLDWAFEHVEEAIILEDDCVPDPTFFRFCQELLAKYRDDERIMVVSGNNFQYGRRRTPYSYYFSRYNHCWGWATWRRAWRLYDDQMSDWPQVEAANMLRAMLETEKAERYWRYLFEQTRKGAVNTWDYRWTYSCWINSGLTILPEANLVSNVGYGVAATNTGRRTQAMDLPTTPMTFPLQHPLSVVRHVAADRFAQDYHYRVSPLHRLRRMVWHGARNLGLSDEQTRALVRAIRR